MKSYFFNVEIATSTERGYASGIHEVDDTKKPAEAYQEITKVLSESLEVKEIEINVKAFYKVE